MVEILLILVAVSAFILGSVPFAFLAGRLFADIDIRRFGSGNPGASNTFRILGPGPGVLVLLLDAGKGAGGVALGILAAGYESPEFAAYFSVLCGLCAVLGHVWSPWLQFRGGKGVGPLLGVFLVVFFWGTLITAGVSTVVVLLSRKFSLGSLASAVCLPLAFVALSSDPWSPEQRPLALLIVAAFFIVMVRHVGNLRRLLTGTEPGLREK